MLLRKWPYNCQIFLTQRHEIFTLGVLGFLKTTQLCPKVSEGFQRLPKISKDILDNSEVFKKMINMLHTAFQKPEILGKVSLFTLIFLFFIYSWFEFTDSGQLRMSWHEMEVFNPQAWDSSLRRESWQVQYV